MIMDRFAILFKTPKSLRNRCLSSGADCRKGGRGIDSILSEQVFTGAANESNDSSCKT